MAYIVGHNAARVPDTFAPYRGLFCPDMPPSPEFVRWLWVITPARAPTIEIIASEGREHGPGHVPLLAMLAPRDIPRVRGHDQRQAVLASLPARVYRESGRQAPRSGVDRWGIECAYFRDLRGESSLEIADRLDLRDDQSRTGEGGSRSARRYYARGRKILASLGAWPWALAADGRLERNWWRVERYADALLIWHREAFCDAVNDVLVTVDGLTVPQTWRVGVERWNEAEALYLRWLERAAAARGSEAA
jgi:hypothetical protein